MERETYIRRALTDHLLNATNYKQLTYAEANEAVSTTRGLLKWFTLQYNSLLTPQERQYLIKSMTVDNPHSEFYILAKVHKTPWGTRPIVSTCGSLLEGLGRWTDLYLQPLCKALPCYIRDSSDFVLQLRSLPVLPPTAKLFTADAIGCYPNINTDHALSVLPQILPDTSRGRALLSALRIIMTCNTFKFGDTFWLQTCGTAMGSVPAPPYAMLYYGVNERKLLDKYKDYLLFYRRFIDDVFGIWNFTDDTSYAMWISFQQDLSFGTLHWTVNEPDLRCTFLDVIVSLSNGTISTTIHEKDLNLHLYLPPSSCHPPGVLKGLIYGSFHRILRLTSKRPAQLACIRKLSRHLLCRGYDRKTLVSLFHAAHNHYLSNPPSLEPTDKPNSIPEDAVLLHLPFHPRDLSSKHIQCYFRDLILAPAGETALPDIRNLNLVPCNIQRLIVAYHRPVNLRNLLFTRCLKDVPGLEVSTLLES